MANFLLLVVAATVVAAIGFGIAAFTLGRDRGLTPPRPDGAPFDLPTDRPLTGEDVRDLRLDTAVRGYRMDQVDVVLERVRHDLDVLWRHVAALEDEVDDLRRAVAPYRPSTNGSGRPPTGSPAAPSASALHGRDTPGPDTPVGLRGAVVDDLPAGLPGRVPDVVEHTGPLPSTRNPRRPRPR